MGLREWRYTMAGMAIGSFWAWFFAGSYLRGVTAAVITALLVGLVELLAYLGRHVRWQR